MAPRRLNPITTGNESNFKDFRAMASNDADPKDFYALASANVSRPGSTPLKSIGQLNETDYGFRLVPPSELANSLRESAEQPVSAEKAAKPPITQAN